MKKYILILIFSITLILSNMKVFCSEAEFMSLFASEDDTDYWNYVSGVPTSSAPKNQDVKNFSDIFTSRGWENTLTSYQAQSTDIQGGQDNEVDLLYWSGHGLADGTMSYYRGNNFVNYDRSNFRGYDVVGDDLVSYNSVDGYKSNSSWNSDMEWAIFATCNQFSTTKLCTSWGRTLLGYPNRSHSAWGYSDDYNGYGYAPIGPTDSSIVNRFGEYSSDGHSVKYSWLMANRYYGKYNWAGVSHYSNRYDRLWGCGTTYATTSVYEEPDIRLYNETLSDPVYDEGTVVNTGSSNNYMNSVTNLSYVTNILHVTNLNSTSNTVNETIKSDNKTVTISADVTGNNIDEASSIKIKRQKSYNKTVEEYFDKDIEDINVKNETSIVDGETIQRKKFSSNGKKIILTNDNEIEIFDNEMKDEGKEIYFDQSKVQEYTSKILNELNLSEENSYTILESDISEQKLDVSSNDSQNENYDQNTIAHTITIGRKIDDIPVSVVNGDRIDIILDKNGFSYLNKCWSNDLVSQESKEKDLISVSEAIDHLESDLENVNISDNSVIESINLVYKKEDYNNNTNYTLNPTWEFWTDESETINVDAYTGDIY